MSRREEVESNLKEIRKDLPDGVTLIVVTKTFPVSDAKLLYELGERDFGENRDVEGAAKSEELPEDTNWHFQGGIQSNKLRSIIGWADYIHSLDNVNHARKIDVLSGELSRRPKVFLQINLDTQVEGSNNSGRSGVAPSEFMLFAAALSEFRNFEIAGVMGVAPIGKDPAPSFKLLSNLSQELQGLIPKARSISAGMSGDYRIALQFGATHIRLGSSILGSR